MDVDQHGDRGSISESRYARVQYGGVADLNLYELQIILRESRNPDFGLSATARRRSAAGSLARRAWGWDEGDGE